MRDIATSMSNCSNGVRQSFKELHRGSGVRESVQFSYALEKKVMWILLKKAHAAFLKEGKDEEKTMKDRAKQERKTRWTFSKNLSS